MDTAGAAAVMTEANESQAKASAEATEELLRQAEAERKLKEAAEDYYA